MKNQLLKQELTAILTNRKLLIPIIAILFIPILYSGMFLWAFWDPYGQLKDLPVVVVNEDKGAEFEGKSLALGDDLVEKLKESQQFQFSFLEKEVAYQALEDQEYYLLVEIPEDFSESATTLLDEDPRKLTLTYVPNEGFNFLTGQIGGTAVEKIKASLSSKVTETYAESMFSQVGDLATGVTEASDGAAKLANGTSELLSGTTTIYEKLGEFVDGANTFQSKMGEASAGSEKLQSGTEQLASGLSQLVTGQTSIAATSTKLGQGESELNKGIQSLHQGLVSADEKVPALLDGTAQLKTGADTLAGGSASLQTGAEQLNAGIIALKQSLQAMISTMPVDSPTRIQLETTLASLETGSKSLVDHAGALTTGAKNLSAGLSEVQSGQQALATGISDLTAGAEKLEDGSNSLVAGQTQFQAGVQTFTEKLAQASEGAKELSSGSANLASGMNQLTDASGALAAGSSQLEEGSQQLVDGTSKLTEGSETLSTALHDGAEKASSVEATDKTLEMMASPVEVETKEVNKVDNYGTGFAPYFLSLGLFVGALLMSIVFPLREPAAIPKNGLNWFMSKFTIIVGIGLIQGIIAATVLLVGLGLKVQNIGLFYLFAIVTSLIFVAMIQLFVTTLGDPGRFIAIIILILQLTTSAGTFPLELIPKALQPIHALLPMTYTVQGFKAVISTGDVAFMWSNLAILLGFAAVCCVGTLAFFTFKHKRQFAVMTQEK